ncbi:unnamed protein product [Periconia digitata]|uniref:Uncharacterized protein n=1 Tax=Periconia digitata TaxID=1303443 RepID=A0A9W4UTG3_9PLEO|nr:unnamed protein product [Periconia digitata]
MQLLDLPAELLHEVLLCAVYSRGVKRALRLKLVCKIFYDHLPRALFESLLLDDFVIPCRYGSRIQFSNYERDNGASKFWYEYLLYRVRKAASRRGPDSIHNGFVEIRQVAEEYSRQAGIDFQETLETVCQMALGSWRSSWVPSQPYTVRGKVIRPEIEDPGNKRRLLAVAACFGNAPLVKQLLSEGVSSTDTDQILYSACQAAAWKDQRNIMQLLYVQTLTNLQLHENSSAGIPFRHTHYNATFSFVTQASCNSEMNGLQFAAYLVSCKPEAATSAVEDFTPDKPGATYLFPVDNACDSLDMFKYMISFKEKPHEFIVRRLRIHASCGNLDIARYILESGYGNCGSDCKHRPDLDRALYLAARHCHSDLVDLLLDHDAQPNIIIPMYRSSAMGAAAIGGDMRIVRKLLEFGGVVDEGVLERAVRIEHTAMVEFFLELGSISVEARLKIRNLAVEVGLDSMADLLKPSYYNWKKPSKHEFDVTSSVDSFNTLGFCSADTLSVA